MIFSILLVGIFQCFTFGEKNKIEYYIAPNGQSTNPGTKNRPFATLTDAKNAILTYRSFHNRSLGNSDLTVWMREGIYCLSESFELGKEDSGDNIARITFKVFPGEKDSLTGAVKVSPDVVNPLSEVRFTERIIDIEAKGKIKEIDLKTLHIKDFGDWKIVGFGRPYVRAGMELFINGKPSTLANFPNKEKIRIHPEDVVDAGTQNELVRPGKIRFPSDQIKLWPDDGNMIACGSFCYAWGKDYKQKPVLRFNGKGKFKIVQLTDLHFQYNSYRSDSVLVLMKNVITNEKPDLIILTGDLVCSKDTRLAWMSFCKVLIEAKIPWAVILGNHDVEYELTGEQILETIVGMPYNLTVNEPENIGGNGNYVLEIQSSKSSETTTLLYCFDSHSGFNPKTNLGTYEWIKCDQIEWYRKQSNIYTT
jgi:hypothetical protein